LGVKTDVTQSLHRARLHQDARSALTQGGRSLEDLELNARTLQRATKRQPTDSSASYQYSSVDRHWRGVHVVDSCVVPFNSRFAQAES
jgi:hypothetical protein